MVEACRILGPLEASVKMTLSPQKEKDTVHACTRARTHARTHTHTHTFNGSFSGSTQVSRYQKGKTNLHFNEARDSEWQWHQLGHVQVWTLLQTDNYVSAPLLNFLQAGCPSCHPTNSVKALKAQALKAQRRKTVEAFLLFLLIFGQTWNCWFKFLFRWLFVYEVYPSRWDIQDGVSRQIATPTPHHSNFTGRMLFLTPNQQCQSTEGILQIWVINQSINQSRFFIVS